MTKKSSFLKNAKFVQAFKEAEESASAIRAACKEKHGNEVDQIHFYQRATVVLDLADEMLLDVEDEVESVKVHVHMTVLYLRGYAVETMKQGILKSAGGAHERVH